MVIISNKKRYFRNAVIDKKWAASIIKKISRAQYIFDQLVIDFDERIPLERKI